MERTPTALTLTFAPAEVPHLLEALWWYREIVANNSDDYPSESDTLSLALLRRVRNEARAAGHDTHAQDED